MFAVPWRVSVPSIMLAISLLCSEGVIAQDPDIGRLCNPRLTSCCDEGFANYSCLSASHSCYCDKFCHTVGDCCDNIFDVGCFPDVCQVGNGGCDHICSNVNNSVECSCSTGYNLAADNFQCDDIDECETDNGGCQQTCNNIPGSFVCSCDNGFILAADNMNCEEFLPFYNLVGIPGLLELPRTEDSNSDPIFVPGRLIFGNQEITRIYVNENGAFSFIQPWMFSHPNSYPTNYLPSRQRHVLSPFWSDVDIRREGTVRYVPITRGLSNMGDTIMNEASLYINARFVNENDAAYQPTWMLVAQWDKVHPYPHGAEERTDEDNLNRTNTFQGVIITDTLKTYYVFTYVCGEMEWSGLETGPAIIGFDTNGEFYGNHEANGLVNIHEIVSCSGPTNGGKANQLPVSANIQQKRIAECVTIARADDAAIADINTFPDLDELPSCPPTKVRLTISTDFQEFPQQTGDCYRSNFVLTGVGSTFEFSTICCYAANGAIIRSGTDAGRLTNLAVENNEGLNFDISNFKVLCCSVSLCARYENKRPISPIALDSTTMCASGIGDPHYTSFDNKRYDFVAAGEYILFGGNDVFHVQGRLGPRGWPATTTVALAFGVPGEYAYQFVQNDQPLLLRTVPTPAQQVNNVDDEHVNIVRTGNSLTANIKDLNIRITATVHSFGAGYFYINYQICVPRFLCELSIGHLGNCDDNPNNDISGSNDYRITEDQTLFTYGENFDRKRRQADDNLEFECTSFDNCGNHSFVGVSFEDLTFTEEQIDMCNNDEICLFDLVVTGDEEFANTTLESSEEDKKIQEAIRNNPPTLTGDDVFHVNVGEENIYTFTVNDTDDFNVTIEGGAPKDGVLTDDGDGEYTFTWTPGVIPNISGLSLVATDSSGAATLHSPSVQVCACFNGGECTEEGVMNINELYLILTCLCDDAYTGDTCIEDKNGCAEIECFNGVECFDVQAPGIGAVCGPCNTGFTGDGEKCLDIDECFEMDNLCDHICENTFGSFICSCEPGYSLHGDVCEDIDECGGVNNCEQDCNNTKGSFECTCGDGFTLNKNGRTCTPLITCDTNNCSHICAVVDGQPQCFCPVGFEMINQTCEDIDECKRFSPCDQLCNNTEGSFECSCDDGFQLQEPALTCEDIDECHEASLASSVICSQENTQCINTHGLFECVCVPGYNLVDMKCERIIGEVIQPAEVIVPSLGSENSISVVIVQTDNNNELIAERLQDFREATAEAITRYCEAQECLLITPGGNMSSFNFTVRPQDIAIPTVITSDSGDVVLTFYTQLSNGNFIFSLVLMSAVEEGADIYELAGFSFDDPCVQSPCLNGANCSSIDGLYTCLCETGYAGRNCSVNVDDCIDNPCENGGTCLDEVNGFSCLCLDGYTGVHCSTIIDDCIDNPCENGGTCLDGISSFTCTCPAGYTGQQCEIITSTPASQTRNHTVIGDPLFTVPYESMIQGKLRNLCFEIHGKKNTHFNLVSDTCVNINALYSGITIPEGRDTNVISSIGIRAEDNNGDCRSIRVDIEACSVSTGINGTLMALGTTTFSMAGISIRKRTSDRVRVSVPNCGNTNMVMWVICEQEDSVDMIRFQIARGINLRPTSHGLLGQFWNIPVLVESVIIPPGSGWEDKADTIYNVTVIPEGDLNDPTDTAPPPRSFLGDLYPRTWDNTKEECLYVGNSQGGPVRGFGSFTDSVIEGIYTDYIVPSLFATEYQFDRIQGVCSL